MTIYFIGVILAAIIALTLLVMNSSEEYKETGRSTFYLIDLIGIVLITFSSWAVLALILFLYITHNHEDWVDKEIFTIRKKLP